MQSTLPSPTDAGQPPRIRLLGELLVERGLVSSGDIQKALAFQDQFGGRLGNILVRLGAISEETLLPVLADQLGIPLLAGSEWPEQPEAIRGLLAGSGFSIDRWLDNGVAAWGREEGLCWSLVLLAALRGPAWPRRAAGLAAAAPGRGGQFQRLSVAHAGAGSGEAAGRRGRAGIGAAAAVLAATLAVSMLSFLVLERPWRELHLPRSGAGRTLQPLPEGAMRPGRQGEGTPRR